MVAYVKYVLKEVENLTFDYGGGYVVEYEKSNRRPTSHVLHSQKNL